MGRALVALCFLVTAAGCSEETSQSKSVICSPRVPRVPCVSARVGVEYPLGIWTHCGVSHVYFAGRYWVIDPPQPEGANSIEGNMTLVTPDELIQFRESDGRQYAFKPAPRSFAPSPCT